MKKLLLLSMLLLTFANASAAILRIDNLIRPVDVVDIRYRICIGKNPCDEATESVSPGGTFEREIFVPQGQIAIVTGLTGTHKEMTVKFPSTCYVTFRSDEQGTFLIKKEDILTCRPASLVSHKMRTK